MKRPRAYTQETPAQSVAERSAYAYVALVHEDGTSCAGKSMLADGQQAADLTTAIWLPYYIACAEPDLIVTPVRVPKGAR